MIVTGKQKSTPRYWVWLAKSFSIQRESDGQLGEKDRGRLVRSRVVGMLENRDNGKGILSGIQMNGRGSKVDIRNKAQNIHLGPTSRPEPTTTQRVQLNSRCTTSTHRKSVKSPPFLYVPVIWMESHGRNPESSMQGQ